MSQSHVRGKPQKVSICNILHISFFSCYILSRMCLEGVWRMSGGFLEGIWMVSGGYLEGVRKVSGICLEDIWNVSGGYLTCARKVTRKSQDSVWRLSGRCLENFNIILSVRKILNVLLAHFSSPHF